MNLKIKLKIEPSIPNIISKTRFLTTIKIIQKKKTKIPKKITIVFEIQLSKSVFLIFIHHKLSYIIGLNYFLNKKN